MMAHDPKNVCANVLCDRINKAELFFGKTHSVSVFFFIIFFKHLGRNDS